MQLFVILRRCHILLYIHTISANESDRISFSIHIYILTARGRNFPRARSQLNESDRISFSIHIYILTARGRNFPRARSQLM